MLRTQAGAFHAARNTNASRRVRADIHQGLPITKKSVIAVIIIFNLKVKHLVFLQLLVQRYGIRVGAPNFLAVKTPRLPAETLYKGIFPFCNGF